MKNISEIEPFFKEIEYVKLPQSRIIGKKVHNGELYFNEEESTPPKKVLNPWHWLIPIRKA